MLMKGMRKLYFFRIDAYKDLAYVILSVCIQLMFYKLLTNDDYYNDLQLYKVHMITLREFMALNIIVMAMKMLYFLVLIE